MPYKFLEDVALADIAFRAEGDTMSELFESAATATFDIMTETGKIKPAMKKAINLKSDKLDTLMYDWIAELLYLKDSLSVVFGRFNVNIKETEGGFDLSAVAEGDKIDYGKYTFMTDVKAITMNMFEVKKEGNRWMATILLDI